MMKRFFLTLFTILLFPTLTFAKVNVVTTLPVFANLAEAIGGERVKIKTLVRANQDPHYLDAKPSYVVALSRADLLILTGMELEIGWLPPVLLQSRNPKIQVGAPGYLDASIGLSPLEVPTGTVDRSMGDIHPLGNPHYWLDPRNFILISQNIFNYLVEVDPAGKDYYQARLGTFLQELKKKIAQWSGLAAPFRRKKIITYHRTWSYFANWTGLQVVANIEPKPGIPPNSKHVDWLIKIIPAENVHTLLMAEYYPKKVPDYLSQKTGIAVIVTPTNPTKGGAESLFLFFDDLIAKIGLQIK